MSDLVCNENFNTLTRKALRNDFASFVRKAFWYDHDGEMLGDEPYVEYLCAELDQVAKGNVKRLVVNLPPRHLKTFLGSVCLSAWTLAHNPGTSILVVANNDNLAEQITYRIRRLLKAPWYKDLFDTRIAQDRSAVREFATTKRGGVFATSVGGVLAGQGADLLIVDDPLDFKDANNIQQIDRVNERFDGPILSRLNNPRKGRVVIIAHRLNTRDLSSHVRAAGGWRRLVLPLTAVRRKRYDLGFDFWTRKKGELLRPGTFTRKQIRQLRARLVNPDFELLYQQGVRKQELIAIKASHFETFDPASVHQLPVVLSVDPNQRAGSNNSFCVIQAWSFVENSYVLLDQRREQCTYQELSSFYWLFYRRFRPSVVIIEATAAGPALIAEAGRKNVCVVEVIPNKRSKAERLINHIPLIRTGKIKLPEKAPWREEFIKEFTNYPRGSSDDQIDATTQFLDWATNNSFPKFVPARAYAGISYSRPQLTNEYPSTIDTKLGVLVRYSR